MNPDTHTTQASWELPEAVWQRMEPLMPPRKSKAGRPQTGEWTWQSVDGAMTKSSLGGRPRAPIPRTVASAGRSAVC
jgi:hypothetical protein